MRSSHKKPKIDETIAKLIDVEAALSLVERTTVLWHQELHNRAKASRYLFRGSGVLVLLLSASLPIIAASAYYTDRVLIAALGSAIGVLSALNTFYRWGDRWRIYRRAELEIEGALREWEATVIEDALKYSQDAEKQKAQIYKSTYELMSRTKAIIETQHLAFFEALQLTLPQVPSSGP